MPVAIHRIGKIYKDAQGGITIEGWHIGPALPQRVAGEPETRLADEIFDGWTFAELVELSVTLGEGAVL
jgi:hypothetical protein